jgi:2-polyprenyl-3-methyl-5-hydroxy-6-metoxy-1,4-benzoquinol methylase
MNKIKELLLDLNISTEDSIVLYHEKVRDRDDVQVLKCSKSEVIFLSSTDHMNKSHYQNTNSFEYWKQNNRKSAKNSTYSDDSRRASQFREIISNQKWLDIGAGAGGVLEILSKFSSECSAVEIQNDAANVLIENGFKVFKSIEEVENDYYDIISLFHVFEHLTDPIAELFEIKKKLKSGGKIIIEVPHAKDMLISFYENKEFENFTFWSEHLILHTRNSLKLFIESTGFIKVVVKGFQRYPLANHLHWLVKGKPGGHIKYNELRNDNIDNAYSELLNSLDFTDTLILTAVKED